MPISSRLLSGPVEASVVCEPAAEVTGAVEVAVAPGVVVAPSLPGSVVPRELDVLVLVLCVVALEPDVFELFVALELFGEDVGVDELDELP